MHACLLVVTLAVACSCGDPECADDMFFGARGMCVYEREREREMVTGRTRERERIRDQSE